VSRRRVFISSESSIFFAEKWVQPLIKAGRALHGCLISSLSLLISSELPAYTSRNTPIPSRRGLSAYVSFYFSPKSLASRRRESVFIVAIRPFDTNWISFPSLSVVDPDGPNKLFQGTQALFSSRRLFLVFCRVNSAVFRDTRRVWIPESPLPDPRRFFLRKTRSLV